MDKANPPDARGLQVLAKDVLGSKISRREFFRRATALGVSATAAGAVLDACSAGSSSTPTPSSTGKKGGSLVFGPYSDGENYDPATNTADYPLPRSPRSTRA